MKWPLRLIIGLVVLEGGCLEPNPLFRPNSPLDGSSPPIDSRGSIDNNISIDGGRTKDAGCIPYSFLGCQKNIRLSCNSFGNGLVYEYCDPYGCNEEHQRCNECDPKAAPTCQQHQLQVCNSDGTLKTSPCPSGCKITYEDQDQDGYGNPAIKAAGCSVPNNYVNNNQDCDDRDERAHPGQLQFFSSGTKGTNSFDYNCDGTTERQIDQLVHCKWQDKQCVGEGWTSGPGALIPACGQSGWLISCTKGLFGKCGEATPPQSQVQGCH
jgi:hypothetical protein